LDNICQIRRK